MLLRFNEMLLKNIMHGNMGIKTIYIGNRKIYTRNGAYLYIELKGD